MNFLYPHIKFDRSINYIIDDSSSGRRKPKNSSNFYSISKIKNRYSENYSFSKISEEEKIKIKTGKVNASDYDNNTINKPDKKLIENVPVQKKRKKRNS